MKWMFTWKEPTGLKLTVEPNLRAAQALEARLTARGILPQIKMVRPRPLTSVPIGGNL